MTTYSDNELIKSIKNGNQSDYSKLVDRYKDRAFTLANSIIKNEMESEEILQDCFLKAFNSLNKFRFESKFSTWFYRIVFNTSLTRINNKKRNTESNFLSLDEFENTLTYDKINDYRKSEISEALSLLIRKLPNNYSVVINLYYLEQMSCNEIGTIIDESVNNVKVLLYRARNALRNIVFENNYTQELL